MQGLDAVDQGNPPTQIAAGGNVTCALLSDGSVWCWGANDQGQLGNGATTSGPNPTPSQVQGLPSATQVAVSVGGTFACAVVTGGAVYCWGANTYGTLGDQGNTPSSTPGAVYGLTNVTSISTGVSHVCAVQGTELWCWGDNSEAELGEGSVTTGQVSPNPALTPVIATEVSGCTTGCPPPVQVTSVACGNKFTCVLVNGGSVECWGDDTFGEIGGGFQSPTSPVSSPSVVSSLSNVTGISAGPFGVCAQVSGLGLSCWGEGPVGNGSTNSASSPVSLTFATCL